MKKNKRPFKKRHILFWVACLAGIAWIVYMPHKHRPAPPASVTVKVQQAPEIIPQEKPPAPVAGPGADMATPVPVSPADTDTSVSAVKPRIPNAGHKPQIALVIDDVGVDLRGSDKAIRLPSFVTLSFLPYALRLREQTQEARRAGHELLLHMPMEPIGQEDPGPGALLTELPMDELRQRFVSALASFTGFDGVNNHMGSKFTAYPEGMDMVVDELQQRHLFYLDSRTSAASVGQQIAEKKGLPTLGRDVFLDDSQSPEAIRAQLQETERVARHKGSAIAIGHPHAATMEILPDWIAQAQQQGFEFVPVRSLITGKEAGPP